MRRILFVACLLAVVAVFCSTLAIPAEEGKKDKKEKALKAKGSLIPHPDEKDVKVLTDDYETIVVTVDSKTAIQASVKAKLPDMGAEAEFNLPKGEVTYVIVDGKAVATKITYSSRETWKMEPPKPKED